MKYTTHKLSFIFLALLVTSFGMIGCGSGNDNDNRFGSRGSISGIPNLLAEDGDCYDIVRSGNGSIQFDFSSRHGVYEQHYVTYVSDGYHSDGKEDTEDNDDGVEIRIFEKYDDRNVLVLVSGVVYMPDRVVDFIMRDIGEDIDEDEVCIYGLDFNYNGSIDLVVEDRYSYLGYTSITLID